ncbi:hypothetical protein L6452_41954 [Arctium lappa]|uniref:Uncharacterized protein n=1 Tax=Arctium lappa TaxID=4217 RepID=A0ACB8XGD6_ARCLA|nr:hypothetical protein L6452_41954 [Arctium lappa]
MGSFSMRTLNDNNYRLLEPDERKLSSLYLTRGEILSPTGNQFVANPVCSILDRQDRYPEDLVLNSIPPATAATLASLISRTVLVLISISLALHNKQQLPPMGNHFVANPVRSVFYCQDQYPVDFSTEFDPTTTFVTLATLIMCNERQMTHIIVSVITDDANLTSICLNSHETRAMQKLIKLLSKAKQRSLIVSALRRITVTLTKNTIGHRVI